MNESPSAGIGTFFARVSWALIGPAVMLVLGIKIAIDRIPIGAAQDAVFAGALVLSIAARFIDRHAPSMVDSAPGSPPSQGRPVVYALAVGAVAASVWLFAHLGWPKLF